MSATAQRADDFAVGVVAAVAMARTMVAISPSLRFDTDPALIAGALAGIGPSGSLLLDAIGLAAVARLLGSRVGRGRALGWAPLLVLLPVPAFLLGAIAPELGIGNLWRGASWIVAALAAVTVAGRGTRARVIVAAVLLGAVAAMLVRSASQMLVEHPAMVAHYEAHRNEFLAARGWSPGSPAALAYERRLHQVEASGWFGLANVLSGVLVAAGLAFAGLAIAAKRAVGAADRNDPASDRRRTSTGLAAAVLALGCVATVIVNGSKGAIATLVIGAAAALVLALARARGGGAARAVPWLLAPLAFAGFVAAAIRGGLLGESSLGERSLLFRWQYLIGSLRMTVREPLTGVGAGGFQDAYIVSRPWFSPEEVASAHAAWLDWLAAFGVGGLGLAALSLLLAWRALRGSASPRDDADPRDGPAASTVAAWTAAGGAALALAVTSWTDFDPAALWLRLIASLAAVVAAWCAAALAAAVDRRALDASLAVAALALLVHGQVDMDFWHPGAAWWCWLLLGAAAGAWPPSTRAGQTPLRWLLVALAVVGAIGLAVTSIRFGAQERALERAALRIERSADSGDAIARAPAAELLEQAIEIEPGNELVWIAAVEQLVLGAETAEPRSPARRAMLERALSLAEDAYAVRPCAATARLRFDAHQRRALDRLGAQQPLTEAERRAALDAAADYLVRDPRSTAGWIQSAELHALLGDRAGAANAAREALRVDASYALDPLRRLNDAERARLERLTTPSRSPEAPRAPGEDPAASSRPEGP